MTAPKKIFGNETNVRSNIVHQNLQKKKKTGETQIKKASGIISFLNNLLEVLSHTEVQLIQPLHI